MSTSAPDGYNSRFRVDLFCAGLTRRILIALRSILLPHEPLLPPEHRPYPSGINESGTGVYEPDPGALRPRVVGGGVQVAVGVRRHTGNHPDRLRWPQPAKLQPPNGATEILSRPHHGFGSFRVGSSRVGKPPSGRTESTGDNPRISGSAELLYHTH
jgi:hypothetical protein